MVGSAGKLAPRVVRTRGVDTKIHHEPPPGVVVGPPRGTEKSGERTCLVVEGPAPAQHYGIHNNSGVNLMRGIVERVLYVRDTGHLAAPAVPKDFRALMGDVRSKLLKYVPLTPIYTRKQFCDCYAGDRRKYTRYTLARLSLEDSPLQPSDARIETFIKCEKINFSAKPDPAPRVIQPRRPRFILEMGRYIKPLERVLYKHMSRTLYNHPSIAKGLNAVQTGALIREKWEMFDKPVCVGMDASRFDQHVSVPALKWTHDVYAKFFQEDPYLKWILQHLLVNAGKAECKESSIKYKVQGRRMSGDIDTALGNCLLMTSMTWQYCYTKGIKHQVMNNGDDIIVIMDQGDLASFQSGVIQFFQKLGFLMEVEAPVHVFEQIEFCQTYPVWNGEGYVMMRKLEAMAKDQVCIIGVHDIRLWFAAVGECGLSITKGLPIYQEFYKWMIRHGKESGIKKHAAYQSGMAFMARGLTAEERDVTDASRVSFYCATGISPDAQIAAEKMFRELGWGGENKGKYPIKDLDELHSMYSPLFVGEKPTWGT